MLVGRAAEQERLRLLLTAARAGKSSSIILRGEPGIGKSALCEYAVEQSAGMAVLRTRGIEAESELAFSGLAELFCAVLEHLEQIPPPQAAALAGALAIGPTVGGDRLTICAATLSLLAAVAED